MVGESSLKQALALFQTGCWRETVACCAAIGADESSYADARHLLGLAASRLGEAGAEAALREAATLRPGNADFRYNLGCFLAENGRQQEAAEEFAAALSIRPHDPAALNNLGNALLALGRLVEAETAFVRALKLDRRNGAIAANLAETLNRMAVVRRETGEEAAAEGLLRRAVELRLDFPEGWNNLGAVLQDLGRHDEAEAAVRHALALRPGYASALGNLGNVLIDTGRLGDAVDAYEAAVAAAPDSPSAHWNLGLARLALGDYRRGFEEFEWRLKLPQARGLYADRGAALWRGESVAGRRLLLYAEQGMGDTLQFVRYAPQLAAQGAEVWIECQAPLARLLATLPGIAGVLPPVAERPAVDFVCPLMSLPHRFATALESIPADVPYLRADPGLTAAWEARFSGRPARPRVGLVWAGEPRREQPDAHRIDRRRSLRLDDFAGLLDIEGIDFVSLQKGAGAAQVVGHPLAARLLDWTGDIDDFADTAALVSCLDLIVSVDTSVAHLAGALAKPVWVLSRHDGCWRWLLDRDDSPWYPTLRLFRQQQPGQWAPVLARVAEALEGWREDRHD